MSIKELKKMLEKNNDVFADIVNGLVFDGEQVVLPNELEDLPLHLQCKTDLELDGLDHTVIKKGKNCIFRLVCIGPDSKAASNPELPLQILASDAELYETQLLDQNEK